MKEDFSYQYFCHAINDIVTKRPLALHKIISDFLNFTINHALSLAIVSLSPHYHKELDFCLRWHVYFIYLVDGKIALLWMKFVTVDFLSNLRQ